MTAVRLTSYQIRERVPLSESVKDELLADGRIRCSPSRGCPGHYDLQADSVVGLVRYGSDQFEIRPRFSTENMLHMLTYGVERARLHRAPVLFAEHESFVHALAAVYAESLRLALVRGLTQGYVEQHERLRVVRGRIDWTDFVRKSFGRAPPVAVVYDDFTEDTPLNRVLKAALVRLLRVLPGGPTRLRRKLQELERVFRLVGALQPQSPVPVIQLDRLSERFRSPLALAKVVLEGSGIRGRAGTVGGLGLLFDVNKVFEDFVVRGVRECLGLDEGTFPQNAARKGLRLDDGGRVKLEPDLSWWSGELCQFVGDVKYKKTAYATVPNADVYQMLAYMEATGLREGLLIYAEGEYRQVFSLPGGRTLGVEIFDLSGGPADLDAELSRLAVVVRRVRENACQDRGLGPEHNRRRAS